MKKIALTFLAALSVFSISAYDLDALKTAMYSNNPELLKIQEEYNRSLLDVKDAWGGFGPVIDLQLSGTYMVNPPVDPIYLNVDDILNSISWPGGTKPSSTGQYVKIYDGMENTLYNMQLSLTQPIFTWGKITNSVKLYRRIADVKKTQLESEKDQKETELETRVSALYYLNRINELLEEEKGYAARLVEASENAERSGMLLHQDVVEAKIQAKELEIAQRDLQEQKNVQLLELQRATGIEDLTLEQIEYSFDEALIDELLKADRDALKEKALSGNQGSIKILSKLKEISKLSESIARGYLYWKPDLALQVTAGYGGSRVPFAEPNWLRKDDYTANISVGIKTTLWDGGKKLRDVSRKISEVNTAEYNQMDARNSISQTLDSQWNTIDVCRMKIEYQDLKIESSDGKIKQLESVFASGYGSETDVLSSKINRCNEIIEKEKESLAMATAYFTIRYLTK